MTHSSPWAPWARDHCTWWKEAMVSAAIGAIAREWRVKDEGKLKKSRESKYISWILTLKRRRKKVE